MQLPQTSSEIKELLDDRYKRYASKLFVDSDPIQIPHLFQKKEDIEISGLITATVSWGNRKAIINSMKKLNGMMNGKPYEFTVNFRPSDEKFLNGFVHRTFSQADCINFILVLKHIYTEMEGLSKLFTLSYKKNKSIPDAINAYREQFVALEIPGKTLRHVPNIYAGSAAKRLNMYLRWMVRPAKESIDFGLWQQISTSNLLIPLDVHSGRVARKLGLLTRKQNDFKAVCELTNELRKLDPSDPVKYDFALFGMGVYGEL